MVNVTPKFKWSMLHPNTNESRFSHQIGYLFDVPWDIKSLIMSGILVMYFQLRSWIEYDLLYMSLLHSDYSNYILWQLGAYNPIIIKTELKVFCKAGHNMQNTRDKDNMCSKQHTKHNRLLQWPQAQWFQRDYIQNVLYCTSKAEGSIIQNVVQTYQTITNS